MKNKNLKSKNQASIKKQHSPKIASPELSKLSVEELNKINGGMGFSEWW